MPMRSGGEREYGKRMIWKASAGRGFRKGDGGSRKTSFPEASTAFS